MFDDFVSAIITDTIYGEIDINGWYSRNKGICNHCGADMKKFDPARNIYPHFTGACCSQKTDPTLTPDADRVVTPLLVDKK